MNKRKKQKWIQHLYFYLPWAIAILLIFARYFDIFALLLLIVSITYGCIVFYFSLYKKEVVSGGSLIVPGGVKKFIIFNASGKDRIAAVLTGIIKIILFTIAPIILLIWGY